MSTHIDDWIQPSYDALIAGERDGMRTADAYKTLAPRLIAGIRDGSISTEEIYDEEWAVRAIQRRMEPTRRKRSRALSRTLEEVADALMDPENGITIWPWASSAYSTGHPDGVDKALRFWLPEDIDMWIEVRAQKARDAVAAA